MYSSIVSIPSVTTASVSDRRSSASGSNAANSPVLNRGPRRTATGLQSVREEGRDEESDPRDSTSTSQWSHENGGRGGVELEEMQPAGPSDIDAAVEGADLQSENEGEDRNDDGERNDDGSAEASEAAERQDDHETGCGCGCNIL